MTALLLHGSASSARVWHGMRDLKTAWGTEVHTPDLPGAVGQTWPAPGDAPDAWRIEDDLALVQQHLAAQHGPIRLGGHSYGGALALRAALQHPDAVCAVYAHEPVLWPVLLTYGSAADAALLTQHFDLDRFLDPSWGGSEAWLHAFVDYWNGEGTWQRFPARMQRAVVASGPKTFREVLACFYDPTPMTTWATLQVPVHLTRGQDSPPAARRLMELLSDLLPHATLTEVPGGHLAPATHATDVLAAWCSAEGIRPPA